MRRSSVVVLKPRARHEAETAGIGDEPSEVQSEIEIAALAVLGLTTDFGDDAADADGQKITNLLRAAARKLDNIGERLSPLDIEATRRKLGEGKVAS